jgi:pSer/pThr/pTyr-binding forkhead associated (FHA) protein
MSITVVVHGEKSPSAARETPPQAITFDMPRVVLGRAESCDVRLPHRTVSLRHATLRQRGSDWLLVDEGSLNGSRLGRVLLSAQAPRVLGPREVIRLGKVWIELIQGQEPATKSSGGAAKSIALAMIADQLADDGEEARPMVRVVEGPETGRLFLLGEGSVVIGRSKDAEWVLEDGEASRRHAEVERRGDAFFVRDLGSKTGSFLDDAPLGESFVAWKPGATLRIGVTSLRFEHAALEALAEIERAPDRKVPASELELAAAEPAIVAPEDPIDLDVTPEDATAEPEPEPTPEPDLALAKASRGKGLWSVTDLAVVVLALGVMSLSAVGYFVLLR